MVTASTRSQHAGLLGGAAAVLAEHAEPVRLVDDEPGAEAVAERHDVGQRRQFAGHRVDAVDGDHHAGPVLEPLEALGQRHHVVVPEPADGGPAGGGTGVHAGVRVGVDEQHVARGADRRQQRDVGVDARRGEDRRLGAVVVGELLLEREVQAGGAVEHPAARRARAELAQRRRGGLDHPRVAGQAQVVVAAEVDPLPAVGVERDGLRGAAGRDGVRARADAVVLAQEGGETVLEQGREGVAPSCGMAVWHRGLPSLRAGSPGCSVGPACAARGCDVNRVLHLRVNE